MGKEMNYGVTEIEKDEFDGTNGADELDESAMNEDDDLLWDDVIATYSKEDQDAAYHEIASNIDVFFARQGQDAIIKNQLEILRKHEYGKLSDEEKEQIAPKNTETQRPKKFEELTETVKNKICLSPEYCSVENRKEIFREHEYGKLSDEEKERIAKTETPKPKKFEELTEEEKDKIHLSLKYYRFEKDLLENARKQRYGNLKDEEKEQIAPKNAETLEIKRFEELTEEEKDKIYLSPEFRSELKKEENDSITFVYICSYMNYPPIRKMISVYLHLGNGKINREDLIQEAREVIIFVLNKWKGENNSKTDKERLRHTIQSRINNSFKVLLSKVLPSFTGNWRHYIAKKTIQTLEEEEGVFYKDVLYSSNDVSSFLDELTNKVNERLQHKKKYSVKVVKTVLEELVSFSEVSLEAIQDGQQESRLAGNNYNEYNSPVEMVVYKRLEMEKLNKRLSDEKDKMILELYLQGYKSGEIGKKVNLTAVAVRKRLERIKKLKRKIKNSNT